LINEYLNLYVVHHGDYKTDSDTGEYVPDYECVTCVRAINKHEAQLKWEQATPSFESYPCVEVRRIRPRCQVASPSDILHIHQRAEARLAAKESKYKRTRAPQYRRGRKHEQQQ